MDVVEVRLRSAEDLKDVRRVKIGKLLHPLFAAAWITPAPAPLDHLNSLPLHHTSANLQTSSASPAHEEQGGTLFPTWQATTTSDIRVHVANACARSNNFLVIRLYAKRARSNLPTRTRHRLVGTVTIPLADIVNDGGYFGHNNWQLLSYNVKLPSGQHQGVLNFSARFTQAWGTPSPLDQHR